MAFYDSLWDNWFYKEQLKEIFGNRKNWGRFCSLVADLERKRFMVRTGQPIY